MKHCSVCKKKISGRNRKTCGLDKCRKLRLKWLKERWRNKGKYISYYRTKKCNICGEEFIPHSGFQRTCFSVHCKRILQKQNKRKHAPKWTKEQVKWKKHCQRLKKKWGSNFRVQYQKEIRMKNIEYICQRERVWRHNNRELHQRRKSNLTIGTIRRVYEDNIKRYGTMTCEYCKRPIKLGKDQLEHKIPISREGTNDYENLCVSCERCNFRKRNKTVEEYENYLRRKKMGHFSPSFKIGNIPLSLS